MAVYGYFMFVKPLDHSKGEQPRRFAMLTVAIRLASVSENTLANRIIHPLFESLHARHLDNVPVAHPQLPTVPRKDTNRLSLSLSEVTDEQKR